MNNYLETLQGEPFFMTKKAIAYESGISYRTICYYFKGNQVTVKNNKKLYDLVNKKKREILSGKK